MERCCCAGKDTVLDNGILKCIAKKRRVSYPEIMSLASETICCVCKELKINGIFDNHKKAEVFRRLSSGKSLSGNNHDSGKKEDGVRNGYHISPRKQRRRRY